jgi:hypothetical protein
MMTRRMKGQGKKEKNVTAGAALDYESTVGCLSA